MTRFTLADVAGTFALDGGRRRPARAGTPPSCSAPTSTSLRLTAVGAGAGERFPWQVDGDYLGDVDELAVAYVPDALSLVLPGAEPISSSSERGARDVGNVGDERRRRRPRRDARSSTGAFTVHTLTCEAAVVRVGHDLLGAAPRHAAPARVERVVTALRRSGP